MQNPSVVCDGLGDINPGDRVRLKDNPSREGTLSSHTSIGEGRRRKHVVDFPGGPEAVPESQLEKVASNPLLRSNLKRAKNAHTQTLKVIRSATRISCLPSKKMSNNSL